MKKLIFLNFVILVLSSSLNGMWRQGARVVRPAIGSQNSTVFNSTLNTQNFLLWNFTRASSVMPKNRKQNDYRYNDIPNDKKSSNFKKYAIGAIGGATLMQLYNKAISIDQEIYDESQQRNINFFENRHVDKEGPEVLGRLNLEKEDQIDEKASKLNKKLIEQCKKERGTCVLLNDINKIELSNSHLNTEEIYTFNLIYNMAVGIYIKHKSGNQKAFMFSYVWPSKVDKGIDGMVNLITKEINEDDPAVEIVVMLHVPQDAESEIELLNITAEVFSKLINEDIESKVLVKFYDPSYNIHRMRTNSMRGSDIAEKQFSIVLTPDPKGSYFTTNFNEKQYFHEIPNVSNK